MSKKYETTAIIYDKRGMVLAIGKNSYVKTHPLQARLARECGDPHKVYLHAEVHAITRCQDISKAHTIKIFRFLENGTHVNAKPCPICQRAIKLAGIKNIEHT